MITTKMSLWEAVAREGAQIKRRQLAREISQITDPTLRCNLSHTTSKLFMFLEEDLETALSEANKAGQTLQTARDHVNRAFEQASHRADKAQSSVNILQTAIRNMIEALDDNDEIAARAYAKTALATLP